MLILRQIYRPRQWNTEARRIGLPYLSVLAFAVGIVTGLGAVAFRDLIGFVHNLLFLGQFAFRYDANLFTPPSPWGPFVLLVPVIGAMGVTFLVTKFAPEARGHGVPEVMDAIYYKSGIIRPIVALVKSLASAIAIGSGAAVGREGPIMQIGSALGSTLGQIIRMLPGQRITLVAAGAGAGIAATFNTPIGGVMFAVELMMPEVSVQTFLPVAIATGTATFVGRLSRRGHLVPKALHANMFLVRRASEVMERDILVLPAETAFDNFLGRPDHGDRMRHVIVTRDNRIFGVDRVNTGLRRGLEGVHTGITLGDVARPNFTIVREDDVVFEVIQRIWRKRAVMVCRDPKASLT